MAETPAQQYAWPPDLVDMQGLAHALSTSPKQVQRLLSAGRLPQADVNVSLTGGVKGRRWDRQKVIRFIQAGQVERP